MSDEDDWFERAIREDDTEDAAEHAESDDTGEQGTETDEAADAREEGAEESEGDDSNAEGTRRKVDEDDGTDQDRTRPPESDSPRDSEGDENPFEQDFADAFENAPSPEDGGVPGEGGRGSSPTNGGGEASPENFGFGDFGEGQGGFEGGQDGLDEAPSGFEEASFDEDSFESDLDRLDIGIEGLDNMILGGVPRRSLMVAIGSAGTGKTTFGLQFLNHGLEQGESAVYITLEESYDRILDTASEKGWDFEGYVEDDKLAIVDIDPVEMANSLDSIQNDLPVLIEEFGADRLVLDSVSLLEMMYEHAPKRRSQVFGFTRALKRAGITTVLTSEANEDNAYASRFGIVEYLADAVFVLQYIRGTDFRETRLAIEIQKIRDANHSRATKPYELTESGISVYRQANIF